MNSLVTNVRDNGGKAPKAILWAPEGEHEICATVNGEPKRVKVVVKESCMAELHKELSEKLAKSVKPIGYFDHEKGVAAYRSKNFVWASGQGVLLEVDWSKAGAEAIEGGGLCLS